MAKILKNIASGLLGTFVSRYNEIDGYWALGILRSLSESRGVSDFAIDLFDDTFLPPGSAFTFISSKYRLWLLDRAQRAGISRHDLTANIRLRFTSFDELPNVVRDTRGMPYVCEVTVGSETHRSYTARKIGVCDCHDPRRESRNSS